jgi:hypothetical protein
MLIKFQIYCNCSAYISVMDNAGLYTPVLWIKTLPSFYVCFIFHLVLLTLSPNILLNESNYSFKTASCLAVFWNGHPWSIRCLFFICEYGIPVDLIILCNSHLLNVCCNCCRQSNMRLTYSIGHYSYFKGLV